MRRAFLSCVVICCTMGLMAQDSLTEGTFRFFSLKLHSGTHLYTGQTLGDKLRNGYGAIEIRTGWQSKGKHAWEKHYKYPSYGIGWYTGYVGDIDIFGNPHALFGFITFPITNGKRNNFQIEPALGLTYNLKPFNPNHNAINDAIGSKFAVYFALHAGGKYRLNREVDLLYGVDLTHFSNGRTVTPNMGLNMAGFSIGGRYNFNARQKLVDNSLHPQTVLQARPILPLRQKPVRIRENNISLYQAIGSVQNKRDAATSNRYTTSSTVLEYQHKFNVMNGVSVGFDAFIDPSARDTAEFPLNKDKQERFFPGFHIGYDFMFWRLTLKLQYGFHLSAMGKELKGNSFLRPAVRYEINKRLFGQLGLKTFNGATADWVEWGIGYKFFYSRKE